MHRRLTCHFAKPAFPRRFGAHARGNVALVMALIVPVLSVFVVGAVEFGFVLNDKGKLQAAADAAALAGAHELALAVDDSVLERAQAMALAQVEALRSRGAVSATAAVVDEGRAIQVNMTAHRDSFFGNMLPPGGFKTSVEAVAVGMGRTPLCVLVSGDSPGDRLHVDDQASIKADGCLVHSNRDILIQASGHVDAGSVQSVGTTSGHVTPEAQVGAEKIDDPFNQRDLAPPMPCALALPDKVLSRGIHRLAPGRHCQDIIVRADAKLKILKGEHYFDNADLILSENSSVEGKDVVLIFDHQSKFEFKDASTVDLFGRTEDRFAGFLIITSRNNHNDFIMWSNNIRNLLGVVYIPETTLIVDGTDDVAAESAWTVIVAERLQLKGSPRLVINHNYALTDVPVPEGVGLTQSAVRLSE